MQPHTIVYLIGVSIFLLLFVMEVTCSLMTKLVHCLCCGLDTEGEVTHSTDIYKELSLEDQ